MTPNPTTSSLALLASSALISTSGAITTSWNTNSTVANDLRWETATSWTNGVPNAVGDTANLDFNITAAKSITLNGDRTIGSLTIGDPASTYAAYTVAAGTPAGRVVFDQTGVADATLGLPVAASTAANVISAGILLNDNLVIDTQPTTVTINVLALSGVINDDAGSFSITKNGPSIMSLGAANTFDGGVVINGGRITASNIASYGTGAVTVADGAQAYLTAAGTYANAFTISGNGITESVGQIGAIRLQGSTISGGITLAGDAKIGTHGSTGTVNGAIGEATAGRFLELANTSTTANSTITLGGNNTYTGGTDIQGAIVIANTNTALGSGPVRVTGNGTAARFTRLQLGTDVTLENDITLDSTAQTDFRGALFSYAGNLATPSVATVNGDVTISSAVGNGGHFASEGSSASVLRIMGSIFSPTQITPTIRIGTVELGGGGDYGQLSLFEGTLRPAASNGINPAAVLTMGASGATIFDLNGFNQTLAGVVRAGAPAATILNNGAGASQLTLDLLQDATFGGSFGAGSGALTVVKPGAAELALTGSSPDFNGVFQVGGGALKITGDLGNSGSITNFQAGTILRGEGTFGGALNLGNMTIEVDGITPASVAALGNLTAGNISVDLKSLPATPGPIEVIGYGGSFGGSVANFSLAGGSNYRTPSFSSSGTSVRLELGAPVDLTWTGTGGNNDWDLNATTNWRNPALTPGKFFIADHARFGDSPASDQTINLPAPVNATNLVFENSLRGYTFEGPGTLIAASLTKNGSGTVSFANPLGISDSITLNAGTLRFAPGDGVAASLPALITGGGTLVKAGAGSLAMSGDNSGFSGPVKIAAGELIANHANALGTSGVEFGTAETTASDICTLTMGSGISASGTFLTVMPECPGAKVGSLGGSIADATVTKRGEGTLRVGHSTTPTSTAAILTGNSSITVEKGILAFDSVTPLSSATTVTLGNSATGSSPTIIEVPPANTADQLVFSSPVVLSADAPDSEAIIRYAGVKTTAANFGGSVALNDRDLIVGNTTHFDGATGRLYNISAVISGDGNVRIRTGTNPDGTYHAGPRARLMGANTFTGDLFVETGMVQIGNGSGSSSYNAIPNTAVVHMSAGTRLGMGSSGDAFAGLTGGGAQGELPAAIVNANVSGTSTPRITLSGGGDYVFGGLMADEQAGRLLALTKSGAGSQTLNGACSFTGTTLLTGGTLVINSSYASAITVSAGATLGGNATSSAALTATAAGAKVSPGQSTGMMSFASANLSTGGVLTIEVNDAAAPACDTISTTGILNVTGSTLDLQVTGSLTAPAYIIASYGSLTGTFGTVNGLPAGYEVDYDYNDGSSSTNIALVAGGADPYAGWLAAYPAITGADRSPEADYDKDGIANGIEFVLGTNPELATSGGLPTGVAGGGNFVFSFKRSDASKAYAVKVQHGTSILPAWPSEIIIPTVATTGPPVTVVENGAADDDVTVTIPMGTDPKKFARLMVDIPFNP